MKIENISSKVIGIGAATILPGETQPIEARYENNPALEIYEGLGLIRRHGSKTQTEAADTEPQGKAAEAEAEAAHRADLLAEVTAGVDEERLGAIAIELGINTATVKSQAGLLKKVKAELSK